MVRKLRTIMPLCQGNVDKLASYSSLGIFIMAMDLELALGAMDNDRQLLEQLATIFSEDAPRIASDFETGVVRQNSKTARIAIHSLKGLAASFFDKQAVEEFAAFELFCVDENWLALSEAPSGVFSRIGSIILEMNESRLLLQSPK